MPSIDESLVVLMLLWTIYRRLRPKPRQCWVRPRNACRKKQGAYHCLVKELRICDRQGFFAYLRMSSTTFEKLLQIVGPRLVHARAHRSATYERPEISPQERLALTIRYLATGNSQSSMSCEFHMGKSTVSCIVKETNRKLATTTVF